MSKGAFGIDISAYQYSKDSLIDFDRMKEQGKVMFVAARAGISWGYTDKWFSRSWSELRRTGMPRLAYHVIRFEDDAQRQADHFLRLVDPREGEKLVLDLEVDSGMTRAEITRTTLGVISAIRKAIGVEPTIYSRANWINAYLAQDEFPKDIELWLAQYLYAKPDPQFTEEHPGPPTLPKVLKNWVMHQVGDKGSGEAVGVCSHYCDYDRFRGDEDALMAWFGVMPATRTLEERVCALEVRVDALEKKG